MAGTAAITGAQRSQLASAQIRKLNSYEQFLGEKSSVQDLITGAINIHIIA